MTKNTLFIFWVPFLRGKYLFGCQETNITESVYQSRWQAFRFYGTHIYISCILDLQKCLNNVFEILVSFENVLLTLKLVIGKKISRLFYLNGQLWSKQKGNVPWMLSPTFKIIFHWKHKRKITLHLWSDLFYREQAKLWIPLKVLRLRLVSTRSYFSGKWSCAHRKSSLFWWGSSRITS